MSAESSSCPSSTEVKQTLKSTYNLNDDEVIMIYKGLNEMNIEKEQLGGRIKQHGGVKCDTLHYLYRNALLLLAVGAGLACVLSTEKAKKIEVAKHFFWTFKDMFDPRHFKDSGDAIKTVTLGLTFLDKVTRLLIDIVKDPSSGKGTMAWVKNILLLFCEVDENKKPIEEVKIDITKVVKEATNELLKNEGIQYTTAEIIKISNDTVVYDGKKELKILVGETIITISPSVTPADPNLEPPAVSIFETGTFPDPKVHGYNANALGYNYNANEPDMYNPDSEYKYKEFDWDTYIKKKGGKRIRKKTKRINGKRINGKSKRRR